MTQHEYSSRGAITAWAPPDVAYVAELGSIQIAPMASGRFRQGMEKPDQVRLTLVREPPGYAELPALHRLRSSLMPTGTKVAIKDGKAPTPVARDVHQPL